MKRIRSFDVLRVISLAVIIYYHMVTRLNITGYYTQETIVSWNTIGYTHIAMPAVAVFFMMSGAVLAMTTKDEFSLGKYLKKRFSRLMIPYYMLSAAYFVLLLITHHGRTDFFSERMESVPIWRVVFNLTGMDGWMQLHGVSSFYLGIGEWFLGVLIILSILFPLFRLAMRKAPLPFLAAATGIYVYFAVRGTPFSEEHTSLLMKGYEFILGMYLGMYFDRIPRKAWRIAVPLTVLLLLIPAEWVFRQAFRTTLQAAGLMISVTGLEPLLRKRRLKALDVLSGYGYEAYLTHHIVIMFLTSKMQPYLGSPGGIAVTFIAEMLATAVIAIALKWSSGKVIRAVTGGKKHEKL